MSFALPYALLLLAPLAALGALAGLGHGSWTTRLPGTWQQIVSPDLRPLIALRSRLSETRAPVLVFALAVLLIAALARPGFDSETQDDFANLAGRVVVLDVGTDLARHRHALDALHRTDPQVATAVVAVAGDAYRIVPFTTDKTQIDRYVRVLTNEMMPEPGQRPHLGLARAEQILQNAGYPVRQIVLLSARHAPDRIVDIPGSDSLRFVVHLDDSLDWSAWASAQDATALGRGELQDITDRLERETRRVVRAELPNARTELTAPIIAFAALLWLLLFRRRTS